MRQIFSPDNWPGFLLIVLMTCASPLSAQELSVNKAIDMALQHYPSILARQSKVFAGQASVIETKHQRLPSLTLYEQIDAGTSNNLGSAYFSAGIVPSISGVSARPENLGTVSTGNIGVAYLQWQVTNFGGFNAAVQQARASLHVDSMDLNREKFYIASILLQSYLDLMKTHELTEIQWENLQRADTIRMAIRNYVVSGLRPGVDSSLAAAEYAKAWLNYLDVRNQLQRSKLQIALLTGLDTATITPNLLNDTILIGAIDTLPATPQTINPQNHPYLDFAHSIYENGQAQEKLIKKSYLPKLYFLGAGWIKGSSINTDGTLNKDLYTGLGYTRSNYLGGLGITYDLFNSRREKDKLKVQQFHTEEALHNYEQQRQTLDNAALQASVDLKTAIDKFQEIPIQLQAAKDAYAQRLTQYNAGLSNIIDLTNALAVLNRAQTDVVNTRSGVWSALVQRAYAGGNIQQLLLNLK